VCKKAANISFYLEQPCETYEECRDVMRYSGTPVILDECMIKMRDLARAAVEGGIGGINLKIGRVGGPTKAKQMRDFCISMQIPVYPMTTNSTEIGDAVVTHLGHSTPEYLLRYATAAFSLSPSSTADGLSFIGNKMIASDQPGLGLKVKEDNLTFLQSWE
jgi:L-alanine-DL-glutamate epimerase-like enolase superfamily enzyme